MKGVEILPLRCDISPNKKELKCYRALCELNQKIVLLDSFSKFWIRLLDFVSHDHALAHPNQ